MCWKNSRASLVLHFPLRFQLLMLSTVIVDQLLFFRGRYFHGFLIFLLWTRFNLPKVLYNIKRTVSGRGANFSAIEKLLNRLGFICCKFYFIRPISDFNPYDDPVVEESNFSASSKSRPVLRRYPRRPEVES
jgi:hypothetical protein